MAFLNDNNNEKCIDPTLKVVVLKKAKYGAQTQEPHVRHDNL